MKDMCKRGNNYVAVIMKDMWRYKEIQIFD